MDRPNRRTLRRWLPVVVITSGVAAAATFAVDRGDGTIDQRGYAPPVTLAGVDVDALQQPASTVSGPLSIDEPPATSPLEAVRRYLDAEAAGRPERSFTVLSDESRGDVGGVGGVVDVEDWVVAADDRPKYESYRVVETKERRVVVEARPVPMVSEIDGVAPMTERIEFAVRTEGGGYRIDLAESTFEPTYPSPKLADAVATTWVSGGQACSPTVTAPLEYAGNLLGALGVTESLCDAVGTPRITRSGGLDSLTDPGFVLSAFGEQAVDWARVVDVSGLTGRAPMQVVLAPFGETWVVVGAVAAG